MRFEPAFEIISQINQRNRLINEIYTIAMSGWHFDNHFSDTRLRYLIKSVGETIITEGYTDTYCRYTVGKLFCEIQHRLALDSIIGVYPALDQHYK